MTLTRSMRILRIHWEFSYMSFLNIPWWNLLSTDHHTRFRWAVDHSRPTCCRLWPSWHIRWSSLISEINWLFTIRRWMINTTSTSCSCSQEGDSTIDSKSLVDSYIGILLRTNWGSLAMVAISWISSTTWLNWLNESISASSHFLPSFLVL